MDRLNLSVAYTEMVHLLPHSYLSLRGDKVSMLTHIYPHKPLRYTEMTVCNHQADSHVMCGLISDLVICKFRKKYGHT